MMRGANDPVGTPQGIHPGCVAWAHAPGATTWPGEGTGNWYDDRWNNQESADWLVANAITTLTGDKNVKKAWASLFKSFNGKVHGQNSGYKKGQKVSIKVNMNNTYNYEESGEVNASRDYGVGLNSLIGKCCRCSSGMHYGF